MIRRILFLSAVLALSGSGAYAADAQSWKSQAACETATHRECVINSARAWTPVAARATQKQAAKSAEKSVEVPASKAKAAPAAKAVEKKDVAPQAKASEDVPQVNAPESVPQSPVVETPPPAPVQEAAQEGGGFFSKLFGGGNKDKTPPVKPVHAAPNAPDTMRPPRPERPQPAVDPEQLLRGKVWTSEGECKKEALKGTCSSVDCATHTGGVCSGFTSMIWIYR